jgi:hypothetical protein
MNAKKVSLPMSTATKLTRLPTIPSGISTQLVNPVNTAVMTFDASVQKLQKQMDIVQSNLNEIKVGQTSVHSTSMSAIPSSITVA